MASAYYNLWLHNGTTWVRVPAITDLKFNTAVNQIGGMSVKVYTRDSAVQTLLKSSSTPYRIMNVAATSGFAFNEAGGVAGNFIIQQGTLNAPSSNEKTSIATTGSMPIMWEISGSEIAERVTKMTFDNTQLSGNTQLATELNSGVGQMFKRSDNNQFLGIVDNLNGTLQGRSGVDIISNGTIDTGPTARVKFRQDNAYSMMLDLAGLGDASTKFPYYVLFDAVPTGVAPNITYLPRVNYISSFNTTFTQPNGSTGVGINNNVSAAGNTSTTIKSSTANFITSGVTNGMLVAIIGGTTTTTAVGQVRTITNVAADTLTVSPAWTVTPGSDNIFSVIESQNVITELTDTRSVDLYVENARVKNAINIKYSGLGSTSTTANQGQLQTGFAVNSPSVTKFGRRELTASLPWAQDSATATLAQNTMLNTYNGMPDGVQGVEIVMRVGKLYNSSGFNACLGDTIALKKKDGTYIAGRFLQVAYEQSSEALMVKIGLPTIDSSSSSNMDIASVTRGNQLSVGSMERTNFQGLTSARPVELDSGATVFSGTSSGANNIRFTTGDQVYATGSVANAEPGATMGTDSAGFVITVKLELNSATLKSNSSGVNLINFLATGEQVFFGPFWVRVGAVINGSTHYVARETFFELPYVSADGIDGTDYGLEFTAMYPFSLTSTSDRIDLVTVEVQRSSFYNQVEGDGFPREGQEADITFSCDITAVPRATLDFSHVHNM